MSRQTPMALFDRRQIEPEPEERKADRAAAARPHHHAENRKPARRFNLEEAKAANLAEADRLRRKRFTDWGINPDAPDAEAQWSAEERRRNLLVQQGWTFIRGRQERMKDWLRERDALDAQAREKKAEEDRKRAAAKAEQRKKLRAPGGAPVNRDWTET